MIKVVEVNNGSRAWKPILRHILLDGSKVKVGENIVLESPTLIITKINDPMNAVLPDDFFWKEEVLKLRYVPEILTNFNPGFEYTYGERLRGSFGLDQINNIIEILKKDRTSRRCVATTWKPCSDLTSTDPPCLDLIDFKLRKGVLSVICYFRSNDMWGAFPANVYALIKLLEYIANELNACIGPLIVISNKGHIYEHNVEDAAKICNIPLSEVDI